LGSFTFDFDASGNSQEAIMSSLDGTGDFDLADGLIKGVNLGKLARAAAQLSEGFNPTALSSIVATARGPSETTDFSQFLSNFTIANGLVSIPAISLNGEYVTMTGKGCEPARANHRHQPFSTRHGFARWRRDHAQFCGARPCRGHIRQSYNRP
ncbi:MAG: AsmA-like C-terminal region-containing protein, partial [Alphaproteobacteria bacterium]|nr:AsmA-like C-terminal region-containing protein [Alphaproteobacteria bacterium]